MCQWLRHFCLSPAGRAAEASLMRPPGEPLELLHTAEHEGLVTATARKVQAEIGQLHRRLDQFFANQAERLREESPGNPTIGQTQRVTGGGERYHAVGRSGNDGSE